MGVAFPVEGHLEVFEGLGVASPVVCLAPATTAAGSNKERMPSIMAIMTMCSLLCGFLATAAFIKASLLGLHPVQACLSQQRIGTLDPMERERFSKRWESVQSGFVDSPKGAVAKADDLVSSLMKTRGYPVSDFDQRAADISVDHPRVVENYRSAHEIAMRVGKDKVTTEDLRTAMIHYRSLFEELVQVPTTVKEREVA